VYRAFSRVCLFVCPSACPRSKRKTVWAISYQSVDIIIKPEAPKARHSVGRIMEILYRARSVFTRSAITPLKSIWMKSGALCAHCWGLAHADFGRDPQSINSLRGSRNFVNFGQVNNARFHGLSVGQIFTTFEHNNVNRCRHVNFLNKIFKTFTVRGRFSKKA